MKELSLSNCRLAGRYIIQKRLGRGTYAEIFLATDEAADPGSPNHEIVIKALNVFLHDDLDPELERTLVENFQNEAIALDRVRHPNVISRLGHGTARDLEGTVFHYIVLTYMPGGDLQSLVRQGRPGLTEALGYLEQVCAGLVHAHAEGVIHRDIKPQNLLLSEDHSTVKIADFGVARLSQAESPITRVGTNLYAAPEHSPLGVARGSAGADGFSLGPTADVYSLAKTTYTLITGEPPRSFAGEQVTSLPDQVSDEPWAGRLLEILKKATSEDPADRHQTVAEFWKELQSLETTEDAGSEPQARITSGYSATAPEMPKFGRVTGKLSISAIPAELASPPPPTPLSAVVHEVPPLASYADQTPSAPRLSRAKRAALRRGAVFLITVAAFTGMLYGTAVYMRGRGVLPEIRNPWAARMGVASTDVYLRPAPNADNEPIGLVTKNSKVRIVNSTNNWYQVDIVEQGRPRPGQPSATRGWLNGRYVQLAEN